MALEEGHYVGELREKRRSRSVSIAQFMPAQVVRGLLDVLIDTGATRQQVKSSQYGPDFAPPNTGSAPASTGLKRPTPEGRGSHRRRQPGGARMTTSVRRCLGLDGAGSHGFSFLRFQTMFIFWEAYFAVYYSAKRRGDHQPGRSEVGRE